MTVLVLEDRSILTDPPKFLLEIPVVPTTGASGKERPTPPGLHAGAAGNIKVKK